MTAASHTFCSISTVVVVVVVVYNIIFVIYIYHKNLMKLYSYTTTVLYIITSVTV